jgi:capsular exopolysaccharide synthesis family protein
VEAADVDAEESAEGVTIDIKRYLYALLRYSWLIAAFVAVAVAGAVLYTLRQVPVYEASASVQIEPKLPDLLGTGDLFNVVATGGQEYYRQQQKVIASYTMCQQTITANDYIPRLLSKAERASLSQADQLDLAARRLMGMIKVRYPDGDRLMYVTVRSADPKFARDVANAQVTTYVNYAKGLLSQNSTDASSALQVEFNAAEARLRAAEDKIYKFQAENDMIAMTLEEHQSLVAQNILAFSQKLNDATAAEIQLASKLAQMKKEAAADPLSSPVAMMGDNASSLDTLRSEYYSEHNHLLELEKDLGPKNSEYLAQKQKVDELYKAVQEAIKMIVDGTQDLYNAQVESDRGLAAQLEKYKQEAKALSPKIVVYNDLMRDKRGIEDEYNVLRARLSATQMTSGVSSTISNVRPLDPALLPTTPVSPRLRVNVLAAAMLALMLGIGFVFLIVFLDRSIKSTADAASAGVPVLGLIPALVASELPKDDEKSRDLYVHEHPTSHVAECCRSLRTNIMLSSMDHPPKLVVVCSANKGEGKTTSAIYLGTTMAQSNQRVLLIDTDMRRPRLHNALGAQRQHGLTNLILGEDRYDEVIKPTDIPNLFLLPCGPLPPNPAELLMSKRFETVLGELGSRFDRIILDTPPLPYTDAVVLSKQTDGVILVVRAGKTLRDELKRSVRTFREVGGTVLGVIVNELDRREGEASYYYYSYYGYNQRDEDEQPPSKSTAA